jgi:hypothetical protein
MATRTLPALTIRPDAEHQISPKPHCYQMGEFASKGALSPLTVTMF